MGIISVICQFLWPEHLVCVSCLMLSLLVVVPFLYMLLPLISLGQYLIIILIVHSFILGLVPSYLVRQKGEVL